MSIWDVLVMVIIGLALFRGYRRGIFLRITGWVGIVLSFFGAFRLRPQVAEYIAPYLDGRSMVSGWIRKYLAHRYGAAQFQTVADVEQWLNSHTFLKAQREVIMTQMLHTNSGAMLERLSDTLAIAGWSLLLLFFTGFLIFLVIGIIGRFLAKYLRRISLFRIIDSFVGATVSGILIFLVLALFSKLLLLFASPDNMVYVWTEQSFFKPLFENLFNTFWQRITGL